jgi:hypothetical protein
MLALRDGPLDGSNALAECLHVGHGRGWTRHPT